MITTNSSQGNSLPFSRAKVQSGFTDINLGFTKDQNDPYVIAFCFPKPSESFPSPIRVLGNKSRVQKFLDEEIRGSLPLQPG